MNKRFHLVVFIPDELYDVPSVMIRHYPVAFKHNAAWFGKPDPAILPNDIRKLNRQIKQGVATQVAILNPHGRSKVVYLADLLCASLTRPDEVQLIPSVYEERGLLPIMKTWLKIGYSMDGYFLDELSDLGDAVAAYNKLERRLLKKGPVNMPGYFFFMLDKP